MNNSYKNDYEGRYVGPKIVSKIIGLTKGTLANWRRFGVGPRYIKLGSNKSSRVLYDLEDIQRFLEENKTNFDD